MEDKEKTKIEKIKFPSELRFDQTGADWVVIATGRAKRPETFKREERAITVPPKETCPFCNISSQEAPVLVFADGRKMPVEKGSIPETWSVIVVPNKYPAFLRNEDLDEKKIGPFKVMNAFGFHEVVITRDHDKHLAQFSLEQAKELMEVYQERYLELMNEKFVHYVSIFHNHGIEAGASIFHPHSQIITTPIMDSDLRKALLNSQEYYAINRKCVYCEMNDWEQEIRERIVFENKEFLVLCPFVSKAAFELIITPKKHLSYFERISDEQKKYLGEAFQVALSSLYSALNNPPYNFYLHTAPCDGKNYDFYHWHWTILPKTATWAGFEIGTRMEISTIEPEKAAEYLRQQLIKS